MFRLHQAPNEYLPTSYDVTVHHIHYKQRTYNQ